MAQIEKPRFAMSSVTVPATYGNAISQQEKADYIVYMLTQLIDSNNEHDVIIQELKAYVGTLDEAVRIKTIEILNQWKEDGTLAGMVGDIIEEFVTPLIEDIYSQPVKSTVDFMRVGRRIYRNEPTAPQSATGDTAKLYTYNQGGCEFYHNGLHLLAQAYLVSNYYPDSDSHKDNSTMIKLYYADTLNNYVPLGHDNNELILNVGHANGMCYKDGYLYIVHNKEWNGTSTPSVNHISRVPVDNFVFEACETQSVPFSTNTGVLDIDEYNGELYIMKSGNPHALYKWDWDTNTVEFLNTFVNLPKYPYYSQGFSITEKYIYLLYYCPSIIVRYNRELNAVDYVYKIPRVLDNGRFVAIEPEWLKVYDDGTCWLETGGHIAGKSACMHDIMQVFKQNLVTQHFVGATLDDSYTGANLTGGVYQANIYVDTPTSNNPIGSQGNPFELLDEAVLFAQTCELQETFKIIVNTTQGTSPVYVYNGRNLQVSLGANAVPNAQGYYNIGNIIVESGTLSLTSDKSNAKFTVISALPQGTSHYGRLLDISDGNAFIQTAYLKAGNGATTGAYIRRAVAVLSSDVDIDSSLTAVDSAVSIVQNNSNIIQV